MILSLVSCSDDDSDSISSRAVISVFENGNPQSGISVHMFRSNQDPNSSFFTPFYSQKSVITESDGKATFNLQETFDLEIIDSQTTLYFGVFDENDNPIGNTGITIEKNETKNATINIE
ncbi:MAG: hypothetical protein R6V37_10920 [Psychroflexus maritimus]